MRHAPTIELACASLGADSSADFRCHDYTLAGLQEDRVVLDEALALSQEAMRLNPVERYYFLRGFVYYMKGRLVGLP